MIINNVSYDGELAVELPRRERTSLMVYSANNNELTQINARGRDYARNTTHTGDIKAIFEDLDRFIYTGAADGTVKKFDQSFEQQWSYSEINGTVTVIIKHHEDGFIYVGSTTGDLAKLDPSDGTQLWRVNPNGSSEITDIAVSIMGDLYVTSTNNTLKKINRSDGSVEWDMTEHSSTVTAVTSSIDTEQYTGDLNGRVIKTDSDGNVVKNESIFSSAVITLSSDMVGNVHGIDVDGNVKTLNSELNETQTFNVSGLGTPTDMVVDHRGRYYIKTENKIGCFSPSGSLEWVLEGYESDVVFVSLFAIMVPPIITEYVFVELEAPTNLVAS